MKYHVSLVIVPIDDFTNRVITKNELKFSAKGEKPAIWKQGFYIFLDLQQTEITLQVESKCYQKQEIHMSIEGRETKILKLRMIPNERYRTNGSCTVVTGRGIPEEVVTFYSDELGQSFRLSKEYRRESFLEIYHAAGLDFTGKMVWIKGREQDWFVTLGELSEEVDNQYEIAPLQDDIRKLEASLYLVHETKCSADGSFYLLLPNGKSEEFRGRFVCGEKELDILLHNNKINQIEFE